MIIWPIPYRDALSAFHIFESDRHAVLLDGAMGREGGRFSSIAAEPSRIIITDESGVAIDGVKQTGDPFDVLHNIWKTYRHDFLPDAPAPFTGGLIGFLGYELGCHLERLPTPKRDPYHLPRMVFGVYPTVAVFDHQARKAWVVSRGENAERNAARWGERFKDAPKLPVLDWSRRAVWKSEQSRADVEAGIRKVIDYIYAGDIFQANYTQRFLAARPEGVSDFDIYRRLCQLNPAPFAAFVRAGDVTLASASPERFLSVDPYGKMRAFPIKGTRRRDVDPVRDAMLADELRRSAKDNAENLMIVDLMRNDLGRVAVMGSVRVPRLCGLESFASVHHLVSEVEAQLKPGLGPIDALRAIFPGGSITGAPKIRAMEIIQELEPSPRGAYCGCLGWIGFDGAMDMSMTIRTLTLTPEVMIAQAGGGIVADSDPGAEYEESMIKLAPLLKAGAGETGSMNDEGKPERRTAG